MGGRAFDPAGGGPRRDLRPAAGALGRLCAGALALSGPRLVECGGQSALGSAPRGGALVALADLPLTPPAWRLAVFAFRHSACVHLGGREPGLRRDDLSANGPRPAPA